MASLANEGMTRYRLRQEEKDKIHSLLQLKFPWAAKLVHHKCDDAYSIITPLPHIHRDDNLLHHCTSTTSSFAKKKSRSTLTTNKNRKRQIQKFDLKNN